MATYGNVYVFNLYVESMTAFALNNQGSAGTIAAPVKTTTPPYVPQQLIVARTNLTVGQLNGPLFVNGANSVLINYGGETWSGTITIPGPPNPSMQADLWVYIAYQQAFLFDTSGTMIPQQGAGATAAGGAKLTASSGGGAAQLTQTSGGSGGGRSGGRTGGRTASGSGGRTGGRTGGSSGGSKSGSTSSKSGSTGKSSGGGGGKSGGKK